MTIPTFTDDHTCVDCKTPLMVVGRVGEEYVCWSCCLKRLAAAEAHEQQTHERLGAILGTDTSLEDAAKRMAERLAAAERVLECGHTARFTTSHFGGEKHGESYCTLCELDALTARLAAAERERDEAKAMASYEVAVAWRDKCWASDERIAELEQRLAAADARDDELVASVNILQSRNTDLTARLAAAEAERDREKERRVHWQGLAYTGMCVVDAVLNNRIRLGEVTTEESMQINSRMAIDKWNFIKAENAALREAAKAEGGV